MELIINDNQAARDAIKKASADTGMSLTAVSRQGGIPKASLARYAHGRTRLIAGREVTSENVYLLTFIKALDVMGYEVVVRPKVTGSRRERRLTALKEKASGRRQGVQPERD